MQPLDLPKVGDLVFLSHFPDGKLEDPWAIGDVEDIDSSMGRPIFKVDGSDRWFHYFQIITKQQADEILAKYKEMISFPKVDDGEPEPPEVRKARAIKAGAIAPAAPKPPLGITPERTHRQHRINALLAAMSRYAAVSKPFPTEWIRELEKLNDEVIYESE